MLLKCIIRKIRTCQFLTRIILVEISIVSVLHTHTQYRCLTGTLLFILSNFLVVVIRFKYLRSEFFFNYTVNNTERKTTFLLHLHNKLLERLLMEIIDESLSIESIHYFIKPLHLFEFSKPSN